MGLAELIAWAMFAVLIAWLGVILLATFRTLAGEARRAAEFDRDEPRGG